MFPPEAIQALHDSHASKWQVSTAGGKHKHKHKHTTVTIHGFARYVEEALVAVQSVRSAVPVELAYKPENEMQLSYLVTFAHIFNEYLRSRWTVELQLYTPGPASPTGAHVGLKGLQGDVAHAKAYLDSVLTSLVSREDTLTVETSFQYKEILNYITRLRESQQHQEEAKEAKEAEAGKGDRTPVESLIHATLSPALDARGVTFMQFPCTITATFTTHQSYSSSIDNLMRKLVTLATEFRFEAIPYASPAGDFIMQKLSERPWRSDFIRQTKISGVLWDPKTLTVQLWARSEQSVENAKLMLNSLCQRPLLSAEAQEGAASSGVEPRTVVVHWPDAVLRYVMLCDVHKQELLSEVRKVQEQCVSVAAQIPYRDKADPLAAMLFSGWPEEVQRVVVQAQDTLKRFQDALHVCRLLMTHEQMALLHAEQLRVVKSVQRRFGVFVNMRGGHEGEAPGPHVNLGTVDARPTAHDETNKINLWNNRLDSRIEGLRSECVLVEGLREDVEQAVSELYRAVNSGALCNLLWKHTPAVQIRS
jgi:hypothetical protein